MQTPLYTYLYSAGTGQSGDSFGSPIDWSEPPKDLEADRWYTVEQRVKLNSPGKANGEIEQWLDGERKLLRDDIMMIPDANNQFGINVLIFQSYFGGRSKCWSHDRDEYIHYRDVIISTDRVRSADKEASQPQDATDGPNFSQALAHADFSTVPRENPATLGTMQRVFAPLRVPRVTLNGGGGAIVDNPRDGSRCLRATHLGTRTKEGKGIGRAWAPVAFRVNSDSQDGYQNNYQELYLFYYLMFGEGWAPDQKGGKLPGLWGGVQSSMAKTCPDGLGESWTARHMWHYDGFSQNGYAGPLATYLYARKTSVGSPSCQENISFPQPKKLQQWKWYGIQQRIRINSSNQSDDGELAEWVDGVKQTDLSGFRWGTTSKARRIRAMVFNSYRGGGTSAWSAPEDTHFYYKDFALSTQPIWGQ